MAKKMMTSTPPADSTRIYVDQANKAYSAGNIKKGKALMEKAGEFNRRKTTATFKTGGVVNPNAKVSAIKSAGSKGVKSGVNPKASAQKAARGKVGGISKAPKTASPSK